MTATKKELFLCLVKTPGRTSELQTEFGPRARGVSRFGPWERVKLNAGVTGNNQCVGKHLAKWTRERAYSPVIEFAGLPGAVETGLAKAGVALWKAAEAEAAAIVVRERLRMAEAIAAERELRHEALGMVDARDAVIEASGTRLRGSRTSSNGRRSTSRR
ncbi:DNA-binding protein [Methylobacterium sp. E-041]|uniref:DNA-binding protein n=1 Tax=Methylobacterium sp. E-041 TaxID=2836573 RepID=UPI001FB89730|nr:DNA-binding protein [Methylobacterium sp. E-041]MCJ2106279.1 DNA-binding protein [Methylobacterium sp. E-041]